MLHSSSKSWRKNVPRVQCSIPHPTKIATKTQTNTKTVLPEDQMPRQWYNIIPDLPIPPPPPLHPGTLQPLQPYDLAPLFPMALVQQEATMDRFVDIPDEVLQVYKLWRPSPLYRCDNDEYIVTWLKNIALRIMSQRTYLVGLSLH